MVPPPDVTHHTNHNNSGQQMMNNLNGCSNGGTQSNQIPKQPQGILKDPNRKQMNNMQILNVQNTVGLVNPIIGTPYDPNNLSTFNTQMGYTDADGHLV